MNRILRPKDRDKTIMGEVQLIWLVSGDFGGGIFCLGCRVGQIYFRPH